jgi:hypothetical protein
MITALIDHDHTGDGGAAGHARTCARQLGRGEHARGARGRGRSSARASTTGQAGVRRRCPSTAATTCEPACTALRRLCSAMWAYIPPAPGAARLLGGPRAVWPLPQTSSNMPINMFSVRAAHHAALPRRTVHGDCNALQRTHTAFTECKALLGTGKQDTWGDTHMTAWCGAVRWLLGAPPRQPPWPVA